MRSGGSSDSRSTSIAWRARRRQLAGVVGRHEALVRVGRQHAWRRPATSRRSAGRRRTPSASASVVRHGRAARPCATRPAPALRTPAPAASRRRAPAADRPRDERRDRPVVDPVDDAGRPMAASSGLAADRGAPAGPSIMSGDRCGVDSATVVERLLACRRACAASTAASVARSRCMSAPTRALHARAVGLGADRCRRSSSSPKLVGSTRAPRAAGR